MPRTSSIVKKTSSPLVDDELVEVHQIRVPHVGERPELLLEEVEGRRVEAEQLLQRDELAALAIEGLVDDAHAALAEAPDHLVASGALPIRRLGDRRLAHLLAV